MLEGIDVSRLVAVLSRLHGRNIMSSHLNIGTARCISPHVHSKIGFRCVHAENKVTREIHVAIVIISLSQV